MKVLFTTLREKSHFFALLPFIDACQRAGHTVGVAAPADFADRIAATGSQFFAVGHPGDEGLTPIWSKFRGASAEDLVRIAIGELFAGACAGAALPSLLEIISDWRPAIVLRESHEFSGIVAAEKAGVAHARIAICAPGAEVEIRQYAARFVDVHRQKLGLSSDPFGECIRSEPALTLFPESYEQSEQPLFRCRASRPNAPPLPQWWPTPDGPLVYLTFGTVSGRFDEIRTVYRAALDAVAALPLRVLLTIGSDLPMDALGDVPTNVHVERFVPQDEVLPHAAAIVCHGGSGSVLGALSAGVPLVITPLFADQPHNAQRVAAIGAGLALPTSNLQTLVLRSALQRVLTEPSFRAAAHGCARDIAALPTLADAAREIERLARG